MIPVPRTSDGPSRASSLCDNCAAELRGPFCHQCGQAVRSPLESGRSFLGDAAASIADLDSRALRSAALLVTRPGALTAEYLQGRRVRYTAPLQVYLAAVALFFLVNAYRPFVTFDPATRRITSSLNAAGVSGNLSKSELTRLERRGISLEVFQERFSGAVTGYLPTFLIGSVLLFALVLALFFRRQPRRYLAHTIFALHWTAFYLLLMMLDRLLPQRQGGPGPVGVVLALTALGYLVLALKRVYGQPWLATFGKAVGLYLVFQTVLIAWMLSAVAIAFAIAL